MAPEAETAGGSAQRLAETQAKIAAAAKSAGRDPADVRPDRRVEDVRRARRSCRCCGPAIAQFGENRVQEAKGKWPELKAQFPDLRLHLIGPLQSNKAKEAVELFDAIHSIDRPKIARAIAEEMKKQGKRLELLVQVNTGEEPQKAGVIPAELPALLALCRDELGLEVGGLMCIPPVDEEPAIHFAFLEKLAAENGFARRSAWA